MRTEIEKKKEQSCPLPGRREKRKKRNDHC